MSTKAEQLALLKKKLSMAKTKIGKAVLEKKIEKLKSEMGSSIKAKKDVTEAKKKVSQMSIAELKKKPEFKFLKKMNKGKIEDDQKHVAKPKGWRFKGKGKYRKPTKAEIVKYRKPTASEISQGKKRGNVYYEARNRHSDVSRIVRLEEGGGVDKYVIKEDKDGTFMILNTQTNMYVDRVFDTRQQAEYWKEEKDIQRKTFGRESYFNNGGGVGREIGYGREKYNALSKESKKKLLHETIGVGTQWFNEDYDKLAVSHQFNIDEYFKGKYATGGGVGYKKDWEVVGITMQGKKFKKVITLGRLSDQTDVKNALRRMDLNIREVTSIKELNTYANGGGVRDNKGLSNSDKFISDQLYYVISVKSISEKKKIIKDSLLPNIDDYVTDNMTNKITKDNLKYALQQKTVASINNVLKRTINAFRKDEFATGGNFGINYNVVYEKPNSDIAYKEVINANSITEAKEKFKRNHPDCTILNIGEQYAKGGGVGKEIQSYEFTVELSSKEDAEKFISEYEDYVGDYASIKQDGKSVFIHNVESGGDIKNSLKKTYELINKYGANHSEDIEYYKKGGGVDKLPKERQANKKYTHFAVSKSTGKIVNGWETVSDVESLKEYAIGDLKDMDLNPKDFKILSKETIIRSGINPFDYNNWRKTEYATGGGVGGYKGKTAEEVWNGWSKQQKQHFIADHNDAIFNITDDADEQKVLEQTVAIRVHGGNVSFKNLEPSIKEALQEHISEGQYATGGGVKNLDKIKRNIGDTVYNHIASLNESELRKQLSELNSEMERELDNSGKSQQYFKYKDEEFFLLYRLGEADKFKYANGGDLFTGEQHRSETMRNGGKLSLNTYKLRAEGLNDFLSFLQTGMYMRMKSFTIEPIGVPDVVVSFVTDASLSEIKSKLKNVQDSHVMLETIKPINEYTGERE